MASSGVALRLLLASLAVGCKHQDVALAGPIAWPTAPSPTPTRTPDADPPQGWPGASDGAPDVAARPIATREADARKPTARCVDPKPVRTGAAQPDLRFTVRGPERMTTTDMPSLAGEIANVSRRAHAIVTPGDGSDAGWRDPVITFTAFIDEGDGCWKPLPAKQLGRCGLFDADWSDEIVRLGPGRKHSMSPMWAFPSFEWREGTVRLFVHYTWTGGAASKGESTTSVGLGAMAREAPYELISAPLEILVG